MSVSQDLETAPILEAREVSKSYPQRTKLLHQPTGVLSAVEGVSCSLRPGETLGLVGESGCGKTTLARLLVGLVSPTQGEVLVRGIPWRRLRGEALLTVRRTIQLIFQDPISSLDPAMTIEELISEPLVIHRIGSREERRAKVLTLLEAVHLPSAYRQRLPRELSGGECQRVGIARALATDPDALICDEPLASLDVSVAAQLLELLRHLCRARHMALVFISHDLAAVATLCRRLAVMKHGRWVEEGATQAILRQPRHPYTQFLIRCATLDLDATAAPQSEEER